MVNIMVKRSLNFYRNNEDEKARVYAIIAYAALLIILGVPLWWKTTEVYRVNLPYDEIEDLAKLAYIVDIVLTVTDENINSDALKILESVLSKAADASNELVTEIYRWTVRYVNAEEREIFKSSRSFTELLELMHNTKILEEPEFIKILILPPTSPLLSDDITFYLGRHRIMLFKIGTDIQTSIDNLLKMVQNVIVKKEDLMDKILSIKAPEMLQQDLASLRSPQYHPAYDVTFTLVNPRPNEVNLFWDIENSVEKFLKPMFQKLSNYADFNVKSQVLYLTSLNVQTYFDTDVNCHYLKLDQLPQVINPLETRLGSYISTNPSLNFVVYIPTKEQSPLLIYDHDGKPSKTNAFLSPRWGGIHIYNVPNLSNNSDYPVSVDLNMNDIMSIFVGQLRLLLGLHNKVDDDKVQLSSFDETSIMDWELDYLMRIRTIENILTATFTLNSLAQLLGEIKYIVINNEVGKHVFDAVDQLKNGFQALKTGNLSKAFQFSKQGFISAEKAFFDPSMLALLYFPDDQKYAVYTPLFLPVSIPVFSSLFLLWKLWKK